MTRRGCQGAASGRPTHLAGGMSRLIISSKRYLTSIQWLQCSCVLHWCLILVCSWACVLLFLLCPQTGHSHNPSSHQSHNTHMIVTSSSSSSSTTPHRVVNQQGYDGMMSKGGQYQPGMPLSVVPSGGPGQYQGNMPQGTLFKKKKKGKNKSASHN